MAIEIRNSNIYKRITEKDFIYKAIYSLESYVFEKDLLDEDDYTLMLKLRDPFNHKIIDKTIENVKNLIDDVLINGKFFEAQVYFRPKKIDKKTDQLESRPLHSSSLNTLIASVVLLNTLLIEIGKDEKNIELTELARMLPSNFYGNIPSDRPEHLFKPWYYQFKEYTDVITRSYYEYTKTKEYKFEVTLDLKNYFPSINPAIIYDEIMSKYSVKYDDVDIQFIKTILSKLLVLKISNLKSDDFIKLYYDSSEIDFLNGEVWTRGIPQGLPHAYFFGNICMVKVAEIFQKVIAGEDGKAFYYVDDSVIYTNNLKNENELVEKINDVNKQLEDLSNQYKNKLEEYKKEAEGTSIKPFVEILDRFDYLIKVHDAESEKSTVLEIQDPKYGQANLNAYSKLASMASYDLSKIFSDTEEINLSKKLEAIYQAVEEEIKRIREIDPEEDTSNYIKVLLRFKKFFKYRQRRLELIRNNNIQENDINELLSNFKVESGITNKDKFKRFFDAYDEDILLNVFRFFFANSPIFWDKAETVVDEFNIETYTDLYKWNHEGEELTIAYFHKICKSLSRRKKIEIESGSSRYDSIQKIVKDNVWNISKSGKQEKEFRIRKAVETFFEAFKNGVKSVDNSDKHNAIINIIQECGLIESSNNRYKLIKMQTDELYRIIMNAYFSEVVSIDANDLKYLAKRNNKPIYYNEGRVLLFLRNRLFRLENFYSKFKDYLNSEVLDYTLFEVIDYFEKFVQDPVYVDNLIMVHKYTSDIWKNGSKYLHFYTLHNQEHAIELIRSIIMFMKSVNYFQISKRDYYILFISCYLHDISMVLHPNLMESFIKDSKESNIIYAEFKQSLKDLFEQDDKGKIKSVELDYIEEQPMKKLLVDFFVKLDQYYEGYVRDNHSKQSAGFIRKSNDFDFVEDVVKDIVAEISQAHGYGVDEIYKIKSNAKESIVSEKYIKILLRIGDLLDMSSNRISNAILDNSQNSMSTTTRFHWLSHKAISNVDIQVKYDSEDKKEKEDNYSYIGPGSIIESISFVIHLDVKHLIGTQSSQICKLKFSMSSYEDNGVKPHFDIIIGSTGMCNECNFMCKWMKIKNDYLYKELEALQLYLNQSKANLFTTNIGVKYEFNDGARRLRNSEYENILKYIANK